MRHQSPRDQSGGLLAFFLNEARVGGVRDAELKPSEFQQGEIEMETTKVESIPVHIAENYRRQHREFDLLENVLPELKIKQDIALAPLVSRRKKLRKRIEALEAEILVAPAKQLHRVRTELKQKKEAKTVLQSEIDAKKEEIGIAAEMTLKRAVCRAHAYLRRIDVVDTLGELPNDHAVTDLEKQEVETYTHAVTIDRLRKQIINL